MLKLQDFESSRCSYRLLVCCVCPRLEYIADCACVLLCASVKHNHGAGSWRIRFKRACPLCMYLHHWQSRMGWYVLMVVRGGIPRDIAVRGGGRARMT